MKTKETLLNEIISHINLTWENNNLKNPNPLVRLMLEETTQELFEANKALDNIEQSILEQLTDRLVPANYNYIRPAHGILHVHPAQPFFFVDKMTTFALKEMPPSLKNDNITAVSFTSIADVRLTDVMTKYLFHLQTLYEIQSDEKKILFESEERGSHTKIWLALYVHPEIDNLKNLSFYIDFEHLPDHHACYSRLHETEWTINGNILKMKSGFTVNGSSVSDTEKDILDFYRDHFLTIETEINPQALKKERFPEELMPTMEDAASSLPFLHWISIDFPANFNREDIEQLMIWTNAFPIINRNFNKKTISKKDIENEIMLTVGTGKILLEMEQVIDSEGQIYAQTDERKNQGTYQIRPIKENNTGSSELIDALERLANAVHDEKNAFREIDNRKITDVLNEIAPFESKDEYRLGNASSKKFSRVTVININPDENASSVDAMYWITHAESIRTIPEKTVLMGRHAVLNKMNAILLSPVTGARNFYKPENLKSISRFYLTSKGRIITKNDILNFCRMELFPFLKEVDVVKKPIVCVNRKEGIINVMEITVKPFTENKDYFLQKGVIKDLLIRLQRISPANFDYRILILE